MQKNMKKNQKQNQTIKKYCKVCHDAGKPESEYSSHFTRESRDPNSKILCPTLLSIECRYCYKFGHTVKYCPIIKDKLKEKKLEEATIRRINGKDKKDKDKKEKGENVVFNLFACLDEDAEEDEENEEYREVSVTIDDDMPAIAPPAPSTIRCGLDYMAAVIKPAVQVSYKIEIKQPEVKPKAKLNWADCYSDTDSDSDSE